MSIRPVRLQLSRRPGFNLQALSRETNGLDAVNVARPSMDGNDFVVGRDGTAAECVAQHRAQIEEACARDPQACELMWKRLRGRNLACWCPLPAAGALDICHAATLLELANRESTK